MVSVVLNCCFERTHGTEKILSQGQGSVRTRSRQRHLVDSLYREWQDPPGTGWAALRRDSALPETEGGCPRRDQATEQLAATPLKHSGAWAGSEAVVQRPR